MEAGSEEEKMDVISVSSDDDGRFVASVVLEVSDAVDGILGAEALRPTALPQKDLGVGQACRAVDRPPEKLWRAARRSCNPPWQFCQPDAPVGHERQLHAGHCRPAAIWRGDGASR